MTRRTALGLLVAAGILAAGLILPPRRPPAAPESPAAASEEESMSPVPSQSGLVIRVMTYNIHAGKGTDGALDLPRLAGVIRRAAPDVVLLQEVDRRTRRSGGVDQAEELGRLTGYDHAFAPAMDLQGGEYGQAVLSRFPIVRFSGHDLPRGPASEPRAALAAELTVPGLNRPLVVVGTHLQYDPRDPTDRILQAQALNELALGYGPRPTVLAGDFNDVPGSEALEILGGVWRPACADSLEPTYPSDGPAGIIDHVFFRPAAAFACESLCVGAVCRPGDEAFAAAVRVASDHLPVAAVLRIADAGPSGETETEPAEDAAEREGK